MTVTVPPSACGLDAALGQIPCGIFVLTAAAEGHRSGVLTRWVQPCAKSPPLLMAAIPTGLSIEPIIRNSRVFALGQIPDGDRLLPRRFGTAPERGDDPFVTLPHWSTPAGAPVPDRVNAWFECELIRHVDLDADHRLLVGRINHGGLRRENERPAIELCGVSIQAWPALGASATGPNESGPASGPALTK